MPRDLSIKKVLVIGSGPIVIGQAAEFDYAGTQACRSLKEEGIEVVLLNSNPATIMTDKDIADSVYIEPLTVEVVEQLIKKEKPDSVLPTLGGQAGLNLAMELEEAGFLRENGVRLIGTTSETIKKAEDRLEFKATMEKIGEPVAAWNSRRQWRKSANLSQLLSSWRVWTTVLHSPIRSVTRSCSVPHIHWAAAAAVSPMTHISS